MITFKFTVCAPDGQEHVEWLDFDSHFLANSYGMKAKSEGKPHGLTVYWSKL